MAIDVRWSADIPQTFLWTISGRWTWDDFYSAFEVEQELKSNCLDCDNTVCDGIALFKTTYVPSGNAIGHVFRVLKIIHKQGHGLTVIVADSPFIKMMVKTIHTLHPEFKQQFFAVDTLEAAFTKIHESRKVR